MKNNIILTGFMGSGKTSVGIRLSYLLKMALVDTDKWIEQKQGMTVSELFYKKGEAFFRQLETDSLKELNETVQNQIISTGGGLPVREENHELLKQLGMVFYLKAEPETIFERLKDDTTRPLLQGADPCEQIAALLKQREPVYQKCADVVIEVNYKSFEEIMEEIKMEWEKSK